ncbi:hypothetical protein [Enorma phocaeensis]|uniref:DUF4062 domain-containing protein n=1 Tax=Enorma phocaeensis TaxID=1871019 RepID=A0A921IWV1_9ACTN|nr:hypothetical protein [Enorma phocaeensis]HJG37739.1 hypothetical protein [Enorma phocaeensis]
MPVTLQSFAVLLSRPGDANGDAEVAAGAIEAVNRQHSRSTGIHFHLLDWKKDSYADSGAEPQQLLNRQIVDDADIVLAIFRERMGTPTQRFDSGTEEEIVLALEAHKPVHIYFWQPPQDYEPADASQYERIESFKARIADRVMYVTYATEQELRDRVTHDFTKRMYELEDEKPVRKPALGLAAIGADGKLWSSPIPQLTALGGIYNPNAITRSITTAFDEAAAIELPKPASEMPSHTDGAASFASALTTVKLQIPTSLASGSLLGSYEKVELSDRDRNLASEVLGELGIEVPDRLFDLGGLHYNKFLAASLYSGDGIEGTDDEKAKYRALQRLIGACRSHREYKRFLSAMRDLVGLPLVVENNGNALATHVVVELLLPQSLRVPIERIPMPDNAFINRELDDGSAIAAFARLPFEIKESHVYRSYEDSHNRLEHGSSIPPLHTRNPGMYPYGRSALDRDDYYEEIEYCFEECSFKPVPDEDAVAVLVEFDRVQQNAAYAYPVILPLRKAPTASLRYRINADELDEPIIGEIEFAAAE